MPWTSSSWATTSPSPPPSSRNFLAASMASSLLGVFVSDWGSPSRITSHPSTSSRTTIRFDMSDRYPGSTSENGLLGVVTEHFLKRGDHLTLRGAGARRVEEMRHQVLAVARRGRLQLCQRALDRRRVACGAGALEPVRLFALRRWVRTMQIDSLFALEAVLVHSDDDPPLGVHLLLVAEGRVRDLALGEP